MTGRERGLTLRNGELPERGPGMPTSMMWANDGEVSCDTLAANLPALPPYAQETKP